MGNIFDDFMRPAYYLLKAKEIEARGPEMPPLLAPDIDEWLNQCLAVNPPEVVERVSKGFIEGNLHKWQEEVRLLQSLQRLGPAGLVDSEADQMLRILNPETEIGRRCRESTQLGRQRFLQLYSAVNNG